MSIEQKIFLLVICAFISGIIIGFCIGHGELERKVREEAIKHNAAQYNPKNGKFEWKELKKND